MGPIEAKVVPVAPSVAILAKRKALTKNPSSIASKGKAIALANTPKKNYLLPVKPKGIVIGAPTVPPMPKPKAEEECLEFGDDEYNLLSAGVLGADRLRRRR